jgi:Uma2 family endonuclease
MTLLQAPPPPSTADIGDEPTEEELVLLEGQAGSEYVDGELRTHTMSLLSVLTAGEAHHRLKSAAGDAFVFQDGLGYRCFPNKPNRYRMPDVSVVRPERLKDVEMDEHGDVGTLPIVPDLAVEVVSINDRAGELDDKLHDYAEAGFPEVWVLFPITRTVTRYLHGQFDAKLAGADELLLPDLLPAFKVRVQDLFPRPGT